VNIQHSLCCSVTLWSSEISKEQRIEYNNNNNNLTGMLIWSSYIAVAILPMPYLGWKGHCEQDKYSNIMIATMNAAQRHGRNIWAMASYKKCMATTLMLFGDCGHRNFLGYVTINSDFMLIHKLCTQNQ
jgi:hypothetical protein